MTVTVRRAAPVGDGFAAVGLLDATGLDLGQVIVRGDLGKVLAGDATTGTVGPAVPDRPVARRGTGPTPRLPAGTWPARSSAGSGP